MNRERQIAYLRENPRECDIACEQLEEMLRMLKTGNRVYGADTRAARSAGYGGKDLYHGGLLATTPQILPGNQPAGNVDFNFDDTSRARMGGTQICRIFAAIAPVAGATAQPIQAAAASSFVEMLVNGVVAVGMVRVPLMSLLPTLNGPPQAVAMTQLVRSGDVVQVRVNFSAFNGASGDGTSLTWVVDAGDCDC